MKAFQSTAVLAGLRGWAISVAQVATSNQPDVG